MAEQRNGTSSRPEGGCCPVLIEGSGETQACDAVRWGRIRTTLLSVATTYEHIAESVERDVGKGRLPDPSHKPSW